MNKLEFFMGLPKTIYFNFKYFNFSTAIKLPVLVSKNVKLHCTKGSILIKSSIKFGMINIGYSNVELFDKSRSRTIWAVKGKVVFNGITNIGHGSKILIHETGTVEFGNNFWITAESQIVCRKQIMFGANVLISWDCLFMDTDYHKIFRNGEYSNQDKPITICDNVWVACRNVILKGSLITNNNVIAANSVVVGKFNEENCLIAGNPAKIIERNIKWSIK